MTDKLNGPIILPRGDKIDNAIIFLHGYGANGNDLINIGNIWKKELNKTLFISPNAPFCCNWSDSAFQWFDLTSISPENIGEGLIKAGPYLNNFIEEVKKKFSLMDDKILFFGFSQGAMMGLYHLCKRKEKCAGLLAYSGLLYENKNFKDETLSKFPIKIYHGLNDEVIDYKYSEKSFERLKDLGFDVELKIRENLGHGIDDEGLNYGLNFIQNSLNF